MLVAKTAVTQADIEEDWPAPPANTAAAGRDLILGLSKSWMWTALAMQDIRLRYRGSLLGPFWLTISTVVMIVAMGLIYAKLFHQDVASYLPFLMVGLIVWQFISVMISEGCTTFLTVATVIQQVPLPFSIHAYRAVCRNLIILAHNAVIIPFGLWFFAVPLDWHLLQIPLGLLLLAVNGVWVSIFFGMTSARFRDVPPIVANFIQVLFFVTPIFWPPSQLGRWQGLAELNPLFAAIDVVRAPLLGMPTAPYSWVVLGAMTLLGCLATFAFFARFRSRIAYWI